MSLHERISKRTNDSRVFKRMVVPRGGTYYAGLKQLFVSEYTRSGRGWLIPTVLGRGCGRRTVLATEFSCDDSYASHLALFDVLYRDGKDPIHFLRRLEANLRCLRNVGRGMLDAEEVLQSFFAGSYLRQNIVLKAVTPFSRIYSLHDSLYR